MELEGPLMVLERRGRLAAERPPVADATLDEQTHQAPQEVVVPATPVTDRVGESGDIGFVLEVGDCLGLRCIGATPLNERLCVSDRLRIRALCIGLAKRRAPEPRLQVVGTQAESPY